MTRTRLAPLFLISAAAVGYEIALTRYFAVAKWSEYGYWVISIAMAGFAFSGVVLTMARDWFARNGAALFACLPSLLVLAASLGFALVTQNPFNPLQLQNPATWQPQIWNILGYYACLLPFFFLTGLYVSLSFVMNPGAVGRVYGYDLTGAGVGAALVLALMMLLHPFRLVPALLMLPAISTLWLRGPLRGASLLGALLALLLGEALLFAGPPPAFSEFKAIYAPLNTPNATVAAEIRSGRGLYQLLDDFTERVDTDVSNDAGLLGVPGPPETYGLYHDGNRIVALPRAGKLAADYAKAALDAAPYSMLTNPHVLLVGASGGFRIAESLALGADAVVALEPEPVLLRALRHGLGPAPPWPQDPRVRLGSEGPIAATARPDAYDLIDISADFLDQSEANSHAFAAEALARYLAALTPDGIVSIPVSIREFPTYALRMLATARAGLARFGVTDPAAHVIAYRSAWSLRILLSPKPWPASRVAAIRKFCDDRSFDVSYYPGIDVAAARAGLYNEMSAVSFDSGETISAGPDDAIADEAEAVLQGRPSPSQAAFNLAPVTFDRPFFYAILNLARLDTILQRLEVLPQAEIGPLVNLLVLAQAIAIAVLVLLVPLRRASAGSAPAGPLSWLRAAALFRRPRARLPVHRDLPDREGVVLPQRPHDGLRAGADRRC